MNKSLFLSFCASIVCASASMTETNFLGLGSAALKGGSGLDLTIIYVLAVALIGVGCLFTLFGLKMFKAIIFIVGFCVVFAPIFIFACLPAISEGSAKTTDLLIAFLLAVIFGIGGGYLALCCHKLAVFLVGFACGCAVFFLAALYLLGNTDSSNTGFVFLIAFIGGVIGGILAIWVHDVMIIIQTSLLGSAMIVCAIDIFVNGIDFATNIWKDAIIFSLIGVIITVVGVVFQYKGRTNEKDMQKQSMISQDPMIVHVNVVQPQVAYQQPYGVPAQGYQQQPGYAAMHPSNDSGDYHQVNN